MDRKRINLAFDLPCPNLTRVWHFARKWLLPNPGTLILMVVLAVAVPVAARPRTAPAATSTSTISYQGRLADNLGNPLTGYFDLSFRIYDSPTATEPLWTEDWDNENSVAVSDGLFNVMLGSINPALADSIADHNELYLGIQVNQDSEMVPRVQLGSVPFSMQAMTVPDLSITTEKIADGAVTSEKLAGYGPGLIRTWTGPDTAFPADGPSQPRVTFDTGIDVDVPAGTTQYYLVTYEGILGYWPWAAIDTTWFHSAWAAQLVDGPELLAVSAMPGLGYRMKWDNFINEWAMTFGMSWVVELDSGTHSLDITIFGYSDGTMSEAFVHNQKLSAFPLR